MITSYNEICFSILYTQFIFICSISLTHTFVDMISLNSVYMLEYYEMKKHVFELFCIDWFTLYDEETYPSAFC